MAGLSERATAAAFLAACRAELEALKPGNVHVHAGGHGMETAQFEAAATAAAPFIADTGLKVGERILRATQASFAAAGCNTNLGILLLTAPLAAAAQIASPGPLRSRLHDVLAGLDAADAANVYEAIRIANPGGLGDAPEQNVNAAPSVGLLEAMALAADRDRVAEAYVTDFAEIFEFGLPKFASLRKLTDDFSLMVTTWHMAYLGHRPDSHIRRKFGQATAIAVQQEALQYASLCDPIVDSRAFATLLAFDASLKERGLNPGTTADFVVATLFTAAI